MEEQETENRAEEERAIEYRGRNGNALPSLSPSTMKDVFGS